MDTIEGLRAERDPDTPDLADELLPRPRACCDWAVIYLGLTPDADTPARTCAHHLTETELRSAHGDR